MVALTLVMMVAEIIGGTYYGSMALVADGWHMATHAAALAIAALAYRYARRHAGNPRFAFGTGKVGDLAGFASAVSLAIVALLIARGVGAAACIHPQPIDFLQAGGIAVLGLIVNLVSAWLLHDDHDHDHDHDDDDTTTTMPCAPPPRHQPARRLPACAGRCADLGAGHPRPASRAGTWAGSGWTRPLGLLGAAVIAHWSIGLARSAGRTLLDSHDDSALEKAVRSRIAGRQPGVPSARPASLAAGPRATRPDGGAARRGICARRTNTVALLADLPNLVHVTIETNPA